MPRKKRPACGTEEVCGGTPAFGAVPRSGWSLRKTPAQSVSVRDDRAKGAGTLMHRRTQKGGYPVCLGVCVCLNLLV